MKFGFFAGLFVFLVIISGLSSFLGDGTISESSELSLSRPYQDDSLPLARRPVSEFSSFLGDVSDSDGSELSLSRSYEYDSPPSARRPIPGISSSMDDVPSYETSELSLSGPYEEDSLLPDEKTGSSLLSRLYEDVYPSLARMPGRTLLSDTPERRTALVAALDGKIHLVDSSSKSVIWSFNSGPPFYSSYQAAIHEDTGKENASGSSDHFFIDCGDDWKLYAQSARTGRTKLDWTVEDFVKNSPFVTEDGAVTVGSKKDTIFEIEPLTGKLIRRYMASDSPSLLLGAEQPNTLNGEEPHDDINDGDTLKSGLVNPVKPRLHITRTDYYLKCFIPGSSEVSWNVSVSEIGATLLCPAVESQSRGAPLNLKDRVSSETDFDSDMPLTCQSRVHIFPPRNGTMLEPPRSAMLSESRKMLPMPSSNLMLLSQPMSGRQLNFPPENLMLPGPTSNLMLSRQKNKESSSTMNDTEVQPLSEMMNDTAVRLLSQMMHDTRIVGQLSMFSGGISAVVLMFVAMLLILAVYRSRKTLVAKQVFLNEQAGILSLKNTSSKRKKIRRSGRNPSNVDKGLSSGNEEMISDDKLNGMLQSDSLFPNGRRIGNLLLSNIEIGFGSNGTVVFEGIYGGRPVAVKRLVQAHHDVAVKEITNLIASDRHPNIVRWHGVERDQDFVYLSLERCTCSLDDLIQINLDGVNIVSSKDQQTKGIVDYKLRLQSVKNILPDVALWKTNGHPSPLLLKLMWDVVSGLEHLHKLGIIHRDLKPQNVLITKEDCLTAKLSDMGISKRLQGDMSSLGHHATGCGSSGWQAPEQLLQGRQTRSVDLFSVGCVLFFCITGGKHPFGDPFERDVNIVNSRMDLFLVEYIPEALDLISQLLNHDPEMRPKASVVLRHPLFWSSGTRLSFLRDTSDRVELEDKEWSDLLRALESVSHLAFGGKWDEKMEPAFISNLGQYRRYKYDSVSDLLRVLRNKLNHYGELPKDIQELVGPVPEGYDGYFRRRYPRLLMEVYKIVFRYCREEERFAKYFRGNPIKLAIAGEYCDVT